MSMLRKIFASDKLLINDDYESENFKKILLGVHIPINYFYAFNVFIYYSVRSIKRIGESLFIFTEKISDGLILSMNEVYIL